MKNKQYTGENSYTILFVYSTGCEFDEMRRLLYLVVYGKWKIDKTNEKHSLKECRYFIYRKWFYYNGGENEKKPKKSG